MAYRLIEALLEGREESAFLDELLSMAAVATVCDVVPLQSENRIIVSRGLELIQNSTNKGLSSLIRQLDLNRDVDSGAIGFRIGPCRADACGGSQGGGCDCGASDRAE